MSGESDSSAAGGGNRAGLVLPIQLEAIPRDPDAGGGEQEEIKKIAPSPGGQGPAQASAEKPAARDETRSERNETDKLKDVVLAADGHHDRSTVELAYRKRSTLDVLWLACSLPEVDAVFARLPHTHDESARDLAHTLLAMYGRQGEVFAAYLRRIEDGSATDPRRKKTKKEFSIDGGRFGLVQQGDQNVITVNTNVIPGEDVSILQQGDRNTIDINLSVDLPDMPSPLYDVSSVKEAQQTVIGDLTQFVQRHIGGETFAGGYGGGAQSPTSPVNAGQSAAAAGTPVDPPDAEDDEGGSSDYSLYASSKLSALGGNLKKAVEVALGLASGGPVAVKTVSNEGNGRVGVTLTENGTPLNSTGKGPSTLVILKLRGPLHEFEQNKPILREQFSSLLHCTPGDIQFIRATTGGSVVLLVAMPTVAYAHLLRLSLLHPSVLRSVGVFVVMPTLHPASIDVANGVDVSVTRAILGGASCRALCDGLFDTFQLSVEQRGQFSDMVSVAHLQDSLIKGGVSVDDVISAKHDSQAKVLRCLQSLGVRGEQEMDCCVAELASTRFKIKRPRGGIEIAAVATSLLRDFLGDDDVHVVSAPNRSVAVAAGDGEYCVTFMLLTATKYRPSTPACKEVLRLDVRIGSSTAAAAVTTATTTAASTDAGATPRDNVHAEDRLASVIASKCSLPSAGVSVRRVAAGGRGAATGVASFLVVLPPCHREFLVSQCRSHGSPVAVALMEGGVTAVRCIGEQQPIVLRRSAARISSLFSRVRHRGKKTTSGQDVKSAIGARREQVANYHFPSTLIAARFHLAGLQIGDICTTNIAVVGPRGVGKSSLINLLASVISQQRSTPCQVSQTQSAPGEWCTRLVSPCWRKNGICLVDTPPIVAEDATSTDAIDEQMKLWLHGVMEGRLNHNEDLHQLSEERRDEIINCRTPARPLAEQIHAVIIVMSRRDVPEDGDYTADSIPRVFDVIRKQFSKPRVRYRGMEPIAVVTNSRPQPPLVVEDAVVHWTRALHGSRFFLDNTLDKDGWYSEALQLEALEVMAAATYSAEQFILRRRHIEQEQVEAAVITESTQVDVLLTKLLGGYNFNKNKLQALASRLQAQGINSRRGIHDSWTVVQDVVGANTIIFDKLQHEMASLAPLSVA